MGEFKLFLAESQWASIAPFIPIQRPLFHATTGPRAIQIIDQGLITVAIKSREI